MNHPLLEQLVAAGQEHVLGFYQELEPAGAHNWTASFKPWTWTCSLS